MKNKYRCAGCEKLVDESNQVMIPWHRIKKSIQSTSLAFCKVCAKKKNKNETGRSLSIKIKWGQYGIKK